MALLECPGCGGRVSDNTDFCSQCGNVIEKKSKRLRLVASVILFPLVVVTISIMNGGNILRLLNPNELTQGESEERQSRSVPMLGHKVRSLAISKMRENEVVVDAAINQEGAELAFLLIVAQGTSTARAETLGTDFVRILESNIKDASEAGGEMAQGHYEILIGVYTPDQKRIAVASKSRNETNLSW